MNKRDELRICIQNTKPDIIAITESWTHADIYDAEVEMDGYKLYRQDRTDTHQGRGGGVLLYVTQKISSVAVECPVIYTNSIWADIITSGGKTRIGVVYRSPNSTEENNSMMYEVLEEMTSTTSVIILGDFNLPGLNWDDMSADTDSQPLLEWALDKGYTQHVDFPTRENNILDLIFTSEPDMVEESQVCGKLGDSDHDMIIAHLTLSVAKMDNHRRVPIFQRMKRNRLRRILQNADWDSLLSGDTEGAWAAFKQFYNEAVESCLPYKTIGEKKKPMWMTRRAQKLVAKKKKLWRRYRQSGRRELFERFQEINQESKEVIRRDKEDFENKMARKIKEDPKTFFAYVRGSQRTRAVVGYLKREDGSLTSTDGETAELLNQQFSSVFTREDVTTIPEPEEIFSGSAEDRLSQILVTEEGVESKLAALKPGKAPGPDLVHPRILKEFSRELAPGLQRLYQKSLDEGIVPQDWRTANVVPLHKGGSKSSVGNYRPVSLTSVICKVLESVLKDAIVSHLKRHRLLNKTQHGFVSGRSCLTNLLTFLEDVTKSVDEGLSVDVIYLDFAKAFDKVPHQRLLAKLKAHGIDGEMCGWIAEWLRGRTQVVTINGASSREVGVMSGVPQGSVLGPILFLVFVNDMDARVKSRLLKFADDTKLYLPLKDDNSWEILQNDLNELCNWSREWQMVFNVNKCATLHFGHGNRRNEYSMRGKALAKVDEIKDLGIIINRNLKPSKQCLAAAKKASRVVGMLYRNITNKTPSIMSRLIKQLVRPHLEYAIQAWSPWLRKDIDLLESVQRRATKMVRGLRDLPYEERLRQLKLTSLESRRERGDKIETFKILRGIDDINPDNFFERSDASQETRGHALKLKKKRARLDVRQKFFTNRVINSFNAIPPRAALAQTVLEFKKCIGEGERATARL